MAYTTPFVRHGALPPSTSRSLDEASPLLDEPSGYTRGNEAASDDNVHRLEGKAPGTASVLWIMASIWIGTATAGLDCLVMATLAAPIANSFNSLYLLAWLATAFLIGQAAIQPLSGKLTDIFSRQWGLVVSNCVFALGNLACGFAQNKWTIILGRILAGVGGGCLNSISTLVVNDLIPLRQRALWQGMSNIFWGLGNGLGGVFGGYINDRWNWRIAFLAQVPLTVLSLFLLCVQFKKIATILPPPRLSSRSSLLSRIDFLGSYLLILTQVLFLFGITTGGNMFPWLSSVVYIPLLLSLVFFCGFLYVEGYVAREPVLPLHFLRDGTVVGACLINLFFHMALFVLMFYLPIYYRILGATLTQAGNALIPIGICLPVGSLVAGAMISRTGRYRYVLWSTILMLLIGTASNSFNALSTPLWLPIAYLVLVGLATGGMLVVTLVAFTSVVKTSEQALVTSLSYVFRSTGSILGVAISSAVYQAVLEGDLRKSLEGLGYDVDDIVGRVKNSLEQVDELSGRLQSVVRGNYMVALRATFWTTAGFALLAVISGLLVRELKLHSTLTVDEHDDVGKHDGNGGGSDP
ncbi:MAG: hypothetical protein Q9176_004214 [Flavoplaca citrina]